MQNFSAKAGWVMPPAEERSGKSQSNEWFMFRSRITVGEPSLTFLRIAADSKYWLYINGELVVREGGLKRGPVPDGSYYDEVDVSAFVHAGDNTVAVLLWYFGRHGFSHRDSGMPGLLADSDSATFSPWKVKTYPAYFDAGYIHDAYRLSENSVGFDARYDLPGWMSPEFDDAGWPFAEAAGKPGDAPWGPLEKREFPQWFWSDLNEYESVEARPSPAGDGTVFYHCKLPHNAHFIPALALRAKAGIRIDISVAQDTNRLCPAYITAEGEQSYECIGWMSGEEVIYKVPSDAVKVSGLTYRETGYPAEFAGTFSCDEPVLNTLWEKARRTLVVNMRDTFMDCPCRERAQWPGDLVVQLGQVPYCLGREADLLVKKGLRETLRWQREDGIIYGPVPEGNWRMELPSQMLSMVGPHGIWTYYMNTADRQTLAELYPFAKRYLDIWEFEKSGLIKYRPDEKGALPKQVNGVSVGTWDWIDWGERIDAEPALNAWFVLAAQGVRQMAEELGLPDDAREILHKEEQVTVAIRKTFWNEAKGGYCSSGFEYGPDDRVQALMVLCGAAAPAQYSQLKCILATVEQACPYMEKYVLEALFAMGDPEAALSRMKRRYKGLVENGNTTLWERWPEWSEHPGTINHSWSGGPLTLLSEQVAGIRPLEPGWTCFAIRPQPGRLNEISASLLLPQGEIRFEARKIERRWKVRVSVPEGTVARPDFSALGLGDVPNKLSCGVWSFEIRIQKPVMEKESVYV
jgi:alpha-L-rhamnosidase